jgi:hypothetical protein
MVALKLILRIFSEKRNKTLDKIVESAYIF